MSIELEKSIFFHALEIEAIDQRNAYVRDACMGDALLHDAIVALLEENDRDRNVVDKPLEAFVQSASNADSTGLRAKWEETEYTPGTMIGSYKLMELIGEGGFGLVFVADQLEPVRRRVAIKIVKPGIASQQIVSRFEAERQALAMMDHENIARVFDAGVTETKQPYFVMELIRGVRLDEFCDNHRMDVRQRLELFVSICSAVQHAHQKGIIHRDLKPSNILVTMHDGRAVPKVIDFGLVKAMTYDLVAQTIYTRFAAMMGTPAYMSPEQAEMSNTDVDTRSDIYSLGVILYELLTGETPVNSSQVSGASFDELRRLIRDDEPPRPSTRVSTMGAESSSTISRNRRLDSVQLKSLLRGDLDCIVMKALEKDRSRRYVSAAALAEDVKRYLREETVEARPPSRWYLFSKFAKRNRIALLTVSVVLVSLVVATTVSLWQTRVAYQAMAQARKYEMRANRSKQEIESFTLRLKKANSLLVTGEAYVQSGHWEEAYQAFTEATQQSPEHFSVWVERASLLARLGIWDAAFADYSKAIELGAPVDGIEFQGVSLLLHCFGDHEACDQIVKELEASQGGFIGTKLRGQLVGEQTEEDLACVLQQAEQLIHDQSSLPSGEPTRSALMPFGVKPYLAGWAHLRLGNAEQAILRLQQSHTDVPEWRGLGIGLPLLAIAHHHLGQDEEAEEALELSKQLLDRSLDESIEQLNGAPPMKWFAWMELVIHYREAHRLIRGELPPADPRFQMRRQKALAVLNHRIRGNGQASPAKRLTHWMQLEEKSKLADYPLVPKSLSQSTR
ncbi:serine/threonine-protein kinase [Bremerella sp. JC770]|uniref:serine/threonine-protein kinase n=1 Tax=Bremerella sp. JC770 TaxID=3232137 RepID=UPI00345B46DD